jgi:hypothetical protein
MASVIPVTVKSGGVRTSPLSQTITEVFIPQRPSRKIEENREIVETFTRSFEVYARKSGSREKFETAKPLKYLFLNDLAGIQPKNKAEIQANSLIYKFFTSKSLFLKDLASVAS